MKEISKNDLENFLTSELTQRYDLSKAVIYKRLKFLHIKPYRQENRSYINGEQLKLMDDLHAHLKAGGKKDEFIQQWMADSKILPQTDELEVEPSALVTQEQAQELMVEPSRAIDITTQELEAIDRQAQYIAARHYIAIQKSVEYYVNTGGFTIPELIDRIRQQRSHPSQWEQTQSIADPAYPTPVADSQSKAKRSWGSSVEKDRLVWFGLGIVTALATVILPLSPIVTGAGVFLIGQAIAALSRRRQGTISPSTDQPACEVIQTQENIRVEPSTPDTTQIRSMTLERLYRVPDFQRIVAALKANGPILVVGMEGSGKTFLAEAVAKELRTELYTVVMIEPATPKQMLTMIAFELGVPTQNLDGKIILLDHLKKAISEYLQENTAFLVVDNAHKCESKFRDWLKDLKRQGVPMLLLATNPPRSDIFINLPVLKLEPLPEYAIRELMEQEALYRGI